MEEFLQNELGLDYVKPTSHVGDGRLNSGISYNTNQGWIYIKYSDFPGSYQMFSGEFESLNAIKKTNTIRVPNPIKVFEKTPLGAALATEHIDFNPLNLKQAELGYKLARMHKQNLDSMEVSQFGFNVATCCGRLQLDNSWKKDWIQFFAENRLKLQVDNLLRNKNQSFCGDVNLMFECLLRKLSSYFQEVNGQIRPSLLHGDVYLGNVGETESECVVFDAGSLYGHSEFDLSPAIMVGGFSDAFFDAYFSVLPKKKGFNKRYKVYQLFHEMNRWNHHGENYMTQTLDLFKQLACSDHCL